MNFWGVYWGIFVFVLLFVIAWWQMENNSLKGEINELQRELEDPEVLKERLEFIRSKKEGTYEEYINQDVIRLNKEHEEYIKNAKENGKL